MSLYIYIYYIIVCMHVAGLQLNFVNGACYDRTALGIRICLHCTIVCITHDTQKIGLVQLEITII